MKTRHLVALLLVLFATACGKSNREVIAENAPAFTALRSKLAAIAAALPPPGTVRAVQSATLTPTPVYAKGEGSEGNLDTLMVEHAPGRS